MSWWNSLSQDNQVRIVTAFVTLFGLLGAIYAGIFALVQAKRCHGYTKEIEATKHANAKDLESDKARMQAELEENVKQRIQIGLEKLKVSLVEEAETARQTALRKAKAIEQIIDCLQEVRPEILSVHRSIIAMAGPPLDFNRLTDVLSASNRVCAVITKVADCLLLAGLTEESKDVRNYAETIENLRAAWGRSIRDGIDSSEPLQTYINAINDSEVMINTLVGKITSSPGLRP